MNKTDSPNSHNLPKRQIEREFFNRVSLEADLNALYAGRQICPPLHKRAGIRYHFLIHYVVNGKGLFETNQTSYGLGSGDAFLIFPETTFSYTASATDPWTYCWVGFAGRKALRLLREAGITPENPIFRAPVIKPLRHCLEKMIQCLQEAKRGHGPKADGYLYHLMSELIAATPPPTLETDTQETYVESAIQFIRTNFARNITIDRLAKHIGFHPTYFSGLFKKKTGMSPQTYVIEYRMQRAKELLTTTKIPINQVASSVGYPDYFAFAKRFRKHTGINPTQFRNQPTALKHTPGAV